MITAEQRLARKKFIGSSDAAAIMALDPFKGPAEIWLEKTGRIAPFEGNDATQRGNYLEPAIISWAEDQLGIPLVRDEMVVAKDGVRAANLDARCAPGADRKGEPLFVVEGKSTSNTELYGEEDSDHVPRRVQVQTHHQLDVVGPEYLLAFVPVLMPVIIPIPREQREPDGPWSRAIFSFKMYRVPRNDDLAHIVEDSVLSFHDKYIKTDTRPDDFKPPLEVLKRVFRKANKTAALPSTAAALFESCLDLRKQKSAIEKESKAADAALLALLEDADAGILPDGRQVTYYETNRAGFTVQPTTFRTLRAVAGGKLLEK